MNSDIPVEKVAIFFSSESLYLKQGINSDYVICIGKLDLRGARTDNNKMKNSCPLLDSNPVPFAYEATSLSLALLERLSIEISNVDRVLP